MRRKQKESEFQGNFWVVLKGKVRDFYGGY
jgi:hypothetical protein